MLAKFLCYLQLVGNEMVPGLSGGERKRTTISEAMVSRGAIDCWDCSTRGLDAGKLSLFWQKKKKKKKKQQQHESF
jgi:ABC-type multidrug transport system ATPase subunit